MLKIEDYKYGTPYKFRQLNVFASYEWMAESTRKYRTVFDRAEINYLRFEFTFFNKLFDEQDWETKLSIKVIDENGKEICNLQEDKIIIKKEENIIYFNQSWGVDTFGGYWTEGKYSVKAFINEVLVGENTFYIYNVGTVTQTFNPYLDIVGLRLFEDASKFTADKKYLKVFKIKETRYVWVEFTFKPKIPENTKLEYFVNILDDAGQLKTSVREYINISPDTNGEQINYTGWGNNKGGSWIDDKYFVNIVFMDTLIASTHFEMGEEIEEGTNLMTEGGSKSPVQQEVQKVEKKEKTKEEVVAQLEELIGLKLVKEQIYDHMKYLEFLNFRREKGFEESEKMSLHSVFTGNPGTGKTTVVKLLGKIYKHMNLLSRGHVYEVDRSELVGEFIGQTAPLVKKAIEKARGGILFIDEAYALYRSKEEEKDYGREVIEILIKEMSDGPGDIAIMAAGYPAEMDTFIKSNPGLKSRFKYYFNFEDYTPDELIDIANFAAGKIDVTINKEAMKLLRKIVTEEYRNRDNTFGNARFAHSIIGQAKKNMGIRIVKNHDFKKLSKKEISTITREDIEPMIKTTKNQTIEIDIDYQLLRKAKEELDKLVGLENVKTEVSELTKLVKYYRETGKNILNSFSMHAVFTGNPGTGKTTIARILGKIYKALGLLEKGHLIESGREGLVAGYVGQTAIKTKEIIDQAMGGVLFIDEAYGLTDGQKNSYGSEAIEIILKAMEDNRGKFAVIAAGYPDNMDNFMKANPGLMSRFDKVMHFKDYNISELMNIADFMTADKDLEFDNQAKQHLKNYLEKLYNFKDKYFGNAREIRKIVEKITRKQNLRMADTDINLRTPQNIKTITIDDVKHLIFEKKQGKSLGFV